MEMPAVNTLWAYTEGCSSSNTPEPKIEPLPVDRRPCIAFRVEASDGLSFHGSGVAPSQDYWYNNQTYLMPRAPPPWRQPTADMFRSHLEWDRSTPTPLVSFYTSWKAALERREVFLRLGATDIDIYAVWIRDHEYIYDTEEVAEKVGVINEGPALFEHEVLLLGGLVSRQTEWHMRFDYGLDFDSFLGDWLVVFDGRRELEEVTFCVGIESSGRKALLPVGRHPSDKEKVLLNDFRVYTGLRGYTDLDTIKSLQDNLWLGLAEWRGDAFKRLRYEMHFYYRKADLKAYILALALSGTLY